VWCGLASVSIVVRAGCAGFEVAGWWLGGVVFEVERRRGVGAVIEMGVFPWCGMCSRMGYRQGRLI